MSGFVLSAIEGSHAQVAKLVATAAVRNLAFNIRIFLFVDFVDSLSLSFSFFDLL